MAKTAEVPKSDPQRALSMDEIDVVRTRRSPNSAIVRGLDKVDDDSPSLPAIPDREVAKYLNNKKDVHYKRILWEVMNRDYLQGNNPKRAKLKKKADPKKNVTKPSPCGVNNEKKLSSRINYDILNKLNEDDAFDSISNLEDVNLEQSTSS